MSGKPTSENGGGEPGMTAPFGGLVLAMDTSMREGSAAIGAPVGKGGGRLEVLGRVTLRAEEEHAALLVPRIRGLMEKVGAELEELVGIVVGAGPGSFTGVRVGAATAKGLARALDLPLWAFSSLAAAAAEDGSGRATSEALTLSSGDSNGILISDFETLRPRFVLFDARGNRVYAAAYRLGESGVETLLEPRATELSEVLDGLIPPAAILMGDGALRHRAILETAGHPVLSPPFGRPTADGLIRLLSLGPETPPLADPGHWEPQYLRPSGAERIRAEKEETRD